MVDDLAVLLVEASCQVCLGCRQPDGVANTLAQGTCVSRSSGGWKSAALLASTCKSVAGSHCATSYAHQS